MDAEMKTPTAAPAMATVVIEPENLPRMMVSFCPAVSYRDAAMKLELAGW